MSVRIQLERPHAYFTNLDFVTGTVVLSNLKDETISEIVVKLEGESRTRLSGWNEQVGGLARQESRPELEVHKLLYHVQTVFPPQDVRTAGHKPSYIVPPGQHVYSFRFKIPFNNDCTSNQQLSLASLNSSIYLRDPSQHVKATLPPSLTGFSGTAEIRYFVKVTVQRPSLFKENFRTAVDFRFVPIEPPRPPESRRESYARRQHQFAPAIYPVSRKNSFFRGDSSPVNPVNPAAETLKVGIDSRLPDPAIVTAVEPLPLRILVKKLNASLETLFLQLLQIELVGQTSVRAIPYIRTERSSWVICSYNNLGIPLVNSSTPVEEDVPIDAKLWNSIPIPNTVAPSFTTCNITRTYSLEIRVGLAHGSPGNIKPELAVQSLRMPVQVYSGIAPPQALLNVMAGRPTPVQPPRPEKPPSLGHVPLRIPTNSSSVTPLARPGQGQIPLPLQADDGFEEPPPSYEDAVAEGMPPVSGVRREYLQSELPPGAARFSTEAGRSSGEGG